MLFGNLRLGHHRGQHDRTTTAISEATFSSLLAGSNAISIHRRCIGSQNISSQQQQRAFRLVRQTETGTGRQAHTRARPNLTMQTDADSAQMDQHITTSSKEGRKEGRRKLGAHDTKVVAAAKRYYFFFYFVADVVLLLLYSRQHGLALHLVSLV